MSPSFHVSLIFFSHHCEKTHWERQAGIIHPFLQTGELRDYKSAFDFKNKQTNTQTNKLTKPKPKKTIHRLLIWWLLIILAQVTCSFPQRPTHAFSGTRCSGIQQILLLVTRTRCSWHTTNTFKNHWLHQSGSDGK